MTDTDLNLREILFQELGYALGSGLESAETSRLSGYTIPNVDSIYYVGNVPVAYFSHFEQVTDSTAERILDLYQRVWNQSKVPLLYVILPQEIHIYNEYTEPVRTYEELSESDRLLRSLTNLKNVEVARQQIRSQLYRDYNRLQLDTGAFWSSVDGQHIKREKRADQRLLRSIDQVRRRLLTLDLPNNIAYALLGRSILIRYLEDRGILSADWLLELTNGRAKSYRAALDDLDIAYGLFEQLDQRFNGDLFPPGNEREFVSSRHLDALGKFLDGYDFDTNQMSFWPYDFLYIPKELISGIYDTFLYSTEKNQTNGVGVESAESTGRRRKLGAYYTPLPLVDYIIQETLPLNEAHSTVTILDPACGSGVFLVRAFQRLVEGWRYNHGEAPTAEQLAGILQKNIFGVDIEADAVQITAFNLYVAMLDYLDNRDILAEGFRFPSLKGNLINADFFSPDVLEQFSGRKFDRVIGNPPWGKGTLNKSEHALRIIEEHDYPVGGGQIVQVFLWYASRLCTPDGEVALLAPAKSTLLVVSEKHEQFRENFLQKSNLRAVINFSALRHELFLASLSPVVALFYRPTSRLQHKKITYSVPKPSPISRHLGVIVVDASEVKYLDLEEVLREPVLWKIASWGTSRDATLIRRLRSFPRLEELERQPRLLRAEILQGLQEEQRGYEPKEAYQLQGKPFLEIRNFVSYYIQEPHEIVQKGLFHRPRDEEIYRGPLALIHRSICKAALYDSNFVVYRDKITGVPAQPGKERLLKWLVAYINSPIARYYHFLTSTSWAVERDTIIHEEYKTMPFIVPDEDDPRLQGVLERFDEIVAIIKTRNEPFTRNNDEAIREHEAVIAELIYDIYDLTLAERQLVDDVVNYQISYFNWAKQKRRNIGGSVAVRPPSTQMLIDYANTFVETVNALLRYQNQTLNATVYQNGAPLNVVGFQLVDAREMQEVGIFDDPDTLRKLLRELDTLLLEQQAPTLYTRRHVRIYQGTRFYLVRPSEARFWTRSQARADADSFITELLARPRTITAVHS